MSKRGHSHSSATDEVSQVEGLLAGLVANIGELAGAGGNAGEAARVAAEGAGLLVELRRTHRAVARAGVELETGLESASRSLDAAHLALESVLYEKAVLLNEIRRCREFVFDTAAIDLIDAETAAAGSQGQSEHEVMLGRLAYEMKERERLVGELAAAQEQVNRSNGRLADESEALDSLHISLDKFLAAGSPIVDALGPSAVSLDSAAARQRIALLPRPLYMLYSQIVAYNGAHTSDALVLDIEGDANEASVMAAAMAAEEAAADASAGPAKRARGLAGVGQEDGDGDGDEDEDEDGGETLYTVFPLSVRLSIAPCEADAFSEPLVLRFVLFAKLNVVAVAVDSSHAAATLVNLFPGDDGVTSPNPSNAFLAPGFTFDPPTATLSGLRPYAWAQWLAGNNFLSSTGVSHSVGVSAILAQLRNRLNASHALAAHLDALARLNLPLADVVSQDFPIKTRTSLTSWTQAGASASAELLGCVPVFAGLPPESTNIYTAVLTRDGATLTAHIAITDEYPGRAPVFDLALTGEPGAARNNVHVMAEEVNVYIRGADIPNDNDILAYQLRKLALCFDVYLETLSSASSAQLLSSKLSLRPFRGRNRAMPFSFNASVGLFQQRLASALEAHNQSAAAAAAAAAAGGVAAMDTE